MLKRPTCLANTFYPTLAQQKGCIINLLDTQMMSPATDYTIYGMTKAALAAQTKGLAKSFAPKVRVNGIAPGAMLWPEGENALSEEDKTHIKKITLLNKLGGSKPIELAVLHCINNDFLTATILPVDGGR